DHPLVPDELKLLPCEDFRDDTQYPFHLDNLVRQLPEPAPRLGKLIAVPSLPAHYLTRSERLQVLRDALRADLDRPVVIGGRRREWACMAWGDRQERPGVLLDTAVESVRLRLEALGHGPI